MTQKIDIFIIIYSDNILIHIKNFYQYYIKAIRLIFKNLRKNDFFTNLKKHHFHKNKIYFLGYIILAYKIRIEDQKSKLSETSLN